MDQPITVIHVSEYPIIRLGVLTYLENIPCIKSLQQPASLSEASGLIAGGDIDVVIVDLALLKPSGLSAIKSILKQDPGIKIIVLSRNEKEPFITQCIESGALGYLSLKCSREELIEAIDTVYRNEKYLSRDVAYDYAIASLNKRDNAISSLTTREYQVFTLLAQGQSINDIASSLFISSKTVHVYRTNIMSKLKLSSAFELTLLAIKQGIISIDAVD